MSGEAPKVRHTGLDGVRKLVDEHRDALGYAVLLDVLNRAERRPVARINLTKSELDAFPDPSPGGAPTPAQRCEALLRPVPVEVKRHGSEPGDRAYMLRLHQPKGGNLASRSFNAERNPLLVAALSDPAVRAMLQDL